MALPSSRNTDYANNTPILPADLNAIQDMLVGINKLFTATANAFWANVNLPGNFSAVGSVKEGGIRTIPVHIPLGINPTAPDYSISVAGGVAANTGYQPASFAANAGKAWPIIGVPVGKRIRAARIKVTDNTAQTLTVKVFSMTQPALSGASWATVATGNTSSGAGTIQLLQATGISHVATTFELLALGVSSATGITTPIIWMGEVDYDESVP